MDDGELQREEEASRSDGEGSVQSIQSNGNDASPPPPPPSQSLTLKRTLNSSSNSGINDHFSRIGSVENPRSCCNYCDVEILYVSDDRQGVANLWAHLNNQCDHYPYKINDKKHKTSAFDLGNEEQGELTIDTSIDGSNNVNVDDLGKAIAKMVLTDGLPVNVVEGEGFKRFVQGMCPGSVIPSTLDVAKDCVKVYIDEKVKLKAALRSERVCLTAETWSTIQELDYICITAQWIDREWKLHRKILNFCQIPDKNRKTIGMALEACLIDWDIDRILTATCDSESPEDGAISFLKRWTCHFKDNILENEFIHVRCCMHIVNLIVQGGLDAYSETVDKIRKAVRYVRSSPGRLQDFKICVRRSWIQCKELPYLDVETRWSTTLTMLDVAEKFKRAFERLQEDDPRYTSFFSGEEEVEDGSDNQQEENRNAKSGPPNADDWKIARSFVKILRIFHDLSLHLSRSTYITASALFREIVSAKTHLNAQCKSADIHLSSMAEHMRAIFQNYWLNYEDLNSMFYVATVLDPSYKMEYIEFGIRRMYGKSRAMSMSDTVKSTLNRVYKNYVKRDSSPNVGASGSSLVPAKDVQVEGKHKYTGDDIWEKYERYLEMERIERSTSEVVKYLEEDCEELGDSLDILGWWKLNSSRFPVLSQVARDVLSIPVSSVSTDSGLCTSSRILDTVRSPLPPNMVEALTCGRNWLHSAPFQTDLQDDTDKVKFYEEIEREFSGARMIKVDYGSLDY